MLLLLQKNDKFSMQGREQVIKVDHTTMLNRIMSVLGASSPPLFTEIDCGEQGAKVSIILDLSFVNKNKDELVEGGIFKTREEAEKNAVLMAFKHLDNDCHINVLDFSSRVAVSFGAYNTYSCVNESMGAVQKMIDKFNMCLTKCKELARDLERKEMKERFSGDINGNGEVYAEHSKAIANVMKRFTIKCVSSKSRMNGLEFEMMKHNNRRSEKAKSTSNKVICR